MTTLHAVHAVLQVAADVAALDAKQRQEYRTHARPWIDERTWAAVTRIDCPGCTSISDHGCAPGQPRCPHCLLGHTTSPGPALECWD